MYSLDDTDELGANAPRPIDEKSLDRANFQQLGKGEGAVKAHAHGSQNRDTEEVPTISRRMMIGLVVAALAIIALSVALFLRAVYVPMTPGEEPEATRVETTIGESLTYRGLMYSLAQKDGAFTLVESSNEGDKNDVVLGSLPGTPLALVLFDGAILMPENLPDGTWNVAAYTVGTGWSYMANQNGEVFGGTGSISEARLDGSTLRLTVDGQIVEVPLEW